MKISWYIWVPWLLGTAVLLAGAGGAGWFARSHSGGESPDTLGASESPNTPARFTVSFGHVDVEPAVTALNPSLPGRVVDVSAHENVPVSMGTELLRIDDQPARARVQEAEADVEAAREQLDEAKKLPERQQRKIRQQNAVIEAMSHRLAAARQFRDRKAELAKINQINAAEVRAAAEAVKEVEAAERGEREKLEELETADVHTGIARAESALKAREARLEQARWALNECVLRAPRDGTVLRVLVGPGDQVGLPSKTPAIFFLPAGPRIVRAEVEQEFANRVAVGRRAVIEDDSRSGATWEAKVIRVSDWYTHRRSILLDPLQFNDVRTLECILELTPGPQPPRIGQRVRVLMEQ
jgi:multidrug resistance efflux pump